mgnify:CR=1 FL=1
MKLPGLSSRWTTPASWAASTTACSAGGAKVVEFTNRGDLAYTVFVELVKHFAEADPSVILGVGSVSDPGTAALYINSGANFVVGPVLNPDVAKACNRRKIAYSPGCGSAGRRWGPGTISRESMPPPSPMPRCCCNGNGCARMTGSCRLN